MKKKVFVSCLLAVAFFTANAQAPVDSSLQQYLGKYKFAEGSVIAEAIVSIDNGTLTMTSSAGTSPLEKQADDLYSVVNFQGTAKFNRDANKKITGVSINAMGYILEGTKVDTAAFADIIKAKYPERSFLYTR